MANGNLTFDEFVKLPEEEKAERYEELNSHDAFKARVTAPLDARSPICNFCKHRLPFNKELRQIQCSAFPDGIPKDILITCEGERDTKKECKNGIKFERKELK